MSLLFTDFRIRPTPRVADPTAALGIGAFFAIFGYNQIIVSYQIGGQLTQAVGLRFLGHTKEKDNRDWLLSSSVRKLQVRLTLGR